MSVLLFLLLLLLVAEGTVHVDVVVVSKHRWECERQRLRE